jgi:hypothetical protein
MVIIIIQEDSAGIAKQNTSDMARGLRGAIKYFHTCDFKAWEMIFRCCNMRKTLEGHSWLTNGMNMDKYAHQSIHENGSLFHRIKISATRNFNSLESNGRTYPPMSDCTNPFIPI